MIHNFIVHLILLIHNLQDMFHNVLYFNMLNNFLLLLFHIFIPLIHILFYIFHMQFNFNNINNQKLNFHYQLLNINYYLDNNLINTFHMQYYSNKQHNKLYQQDFIYITLLNLHNKILNMSHNYLYLIYILHMLLKFFNVKYKIYLKLNNNLLNILNILKMILKEYLLYHKFHNC